MSGMKQTRAAVVVGAVAVLATLGGLWLALGWGSIERSHWLGLQLVRIGAIGLVFMAGFVAGGMFLADRRAGGGGERGPGPGPVEPAPDPFDLAIQRLLDDEATRRP